ncbi:MAG: ABC transporter substrate-binding protein [Cyanobacteriota bacterium]|nr:ABC transporter substrate-binding protein [Cyanobacteriota bacterium]
MPPFIRRHFWIFGILNLLVWLLAACGEPTVVRETLVSSVISDPKTFNPYLQAESSSREVTAYLQAGLTRLNPDTLLPEPELAEKWEVFDEGLRYVFTLKSGLRWSDGYPLTMEDVDFTFNQIIFNEKIPTSSRDVQRIGESGTLPTVTLLNESQIEFILPEPFAPFLIQAGASIVPKHIFLPTLEQVDEQGNPLFLKSWGIDTPVHQLISAGPYIIAEYTPGQRVVYRANSHYWKKGSQGELLPKIRRLVIRIVDSQDTALLQFRSGETDSYSVRGSDFQLLKREEDRDQFTIYNLGSTLNNNFISFNQSKARDPKSGKPFVDPIKSQWFNDIFFRRAVAYAMHKQGYVDSVQQGLGEPQDSVISPASPFHLSRQDGLLVYDYDPQKARDLLLSAGYRYDNNQRLRDPQDHLVRFTLNTNSGNNQREATGSLIKSDLDQIGITVDFVPIAFNKLVEITDQRAWEAIILAFGGGGTEPNNGSNIWRSTGRLHLWNLGDLPDSRAEGVEVTEWEQEIDRIFNQGTRELEFAKRKILYDRFQVIIQEQLPLIGTFNPLVLDAIRNRLEGVDPRPILGSLWNLDEIILAN